MKKILFCLIMCLAYTCICAQKPYSICDFSGQVRIKENKSQQWIPAQNNQAVSGLDSLEISKKGFVRIIDTRTNPNQIYKSIRTGRTRVLNIINDAKKQSSGTLRMLNNELLASAKAQSKTPTMQVIGATTRALEDEDALEDSITNTFVYIAQQALESKLQRNDKIQLIQHKKGEEISFTISNESENGYCVNVLCVNKAEQTVSLCYVLAEELLEPEDLPCLYLPQNQHLDLSSVLFANNPNDIFILVATENLYRTDVVANALKYISLTTPINPTYERYVIGM